MRKVKNDNSDKPEHKTIEQVVKVYNLINLPRPNSQGLYYLVYFEYNKVIAIFKGDYSKANPIELPEYIFKVSQILRANFRIPQKPLDITLEFKHTQASIDIQFKDEQFKLVFGTMISKLLKHEDPKNLTSDESSDYTETELKYKFAKLMEAKNFESYKENYDYRKIFNISHLKKFAPIYNVESDYHKYLYNRFFCGKLYIVTKHKTKMTVKSIVKHAGSTDEQYHCFFILSKGIYNLKKNNLSDYPNIITDFTSSEYFPKWMDPDTVYLFKKKNISEDNDNNIAPYYKIYHIADCVDVELIDGDKFIIRVEYATFTDILVFENIIEAWKFYNYIKILILNYREFRRSMIYDIKLNIRILFDDYRFDAMENMVMILFLKFNAEYVRAICEKHKIILDENEVNFSALNKFLQIFLASYYSNCSSSTNMDKLKIFINKLHDVYLKFILEALSNPYTEVTLLA